MERPTRGSSVSALILPVAEAPPTLFVQAEPHTFRDLVQKHTGAPAGDSPDKLPPTAAPSARAVMGPRRAAFKLHDRRTSVRKIKLGPTALHQHQQARMLPRSPSLPRQQYLLFAAAEGLKAAASFPSPVSLLGSDPLFSPPSGASEEEKAIAEKRFYLHPSPQVTQRGPETPELLSLFPLMSPESSSTVEREAEREQLSLH